MTKLEKRGLVIGAAIVVAIIPTYVALYFFLVWFRTDSWEIEAPVTSTGGELVAHLELEPTQRASAVAMLSTSSVIELSDAAALQLLSQIPAEEPDSRAYLVRGLRRNDIRRADTALLASGGLEVIVDDGDCFMELFPQGFERFPVVVVLRKPPTHLEIWRSQTCL